MIYKELGRTGEKISALGMGTWKIPNDSQGGIDAIRYGIENGINFIDTAEMYGNEELVGKAIKGIDSAFIATKVSPSHFSYDDVIRACENSLHRLGRKSIDLYQLHWPNSRIPISETMRAMEKLHDEGKIRHIGVSNFSINEMIEAQEALSHTEIVSNQVEYSIVMREPEEGLLQFCNRESVTLIAYSPLARGAITRNQQLMKVLKEIGDKYKKTPVQVALNYLISSGNVIPIPKASTKEHIEENIGAVPWRLSEDDLSRLKSMDNFKRPPLAGKMLKAFLKNTTIWSRVMERIEKM
ncbi:MAG: aldo/keto reductase, partial [Candidatus Micrarchaeaceae archaeon]